MNQTSQLIVMIRFSYTALIGFRRKHKDYNFYLDYLYDKARLSARFDLFETITIPSLKAQSNPDFRVVILVGEDFPDWAAARLEKAMNGLNYKIARKPAMGMRVCCHELYQEEFEKDNRLRISVRLDDDDAISRDWMKILHDSASGLAPMLKTYKKIAVYPSYGIMIDTISNDRPLAPVFAKRPQSVGTALITDPDVEDSVFDVQHQKLTESLMTLSVPEGPHFLRMMHHDNGSRAPGVVSSEQVRYLKSEPAEILAELNTRFGIDINALDRFFSHA